MGLHASEYVLDCEGGQGHQDEVRLRDDILGIAGDGHRLAFVLLQVLGVCAVLHNNSAVLVDGCLEALGLIPEICKDGDVKAPGGQEGGEDVGRVARAADTNRWLLLLAVHLCHVGNELDETVGVAPLIVVPGDELHKVVVQGDARGLVEDGGELAGNEVRGDDLLVLHREHAPHGAARRLLDLLGDRVHAGALAEPAGEVHHGHVRGRHAEGHARELAVQGRDDLADGLSRARRGGDDVLGGAPAAAPVLAAPARAVDRQLGSGHCMHRRHEALHDSELLVHNLGQW
mmetsp:Transcript_75117/g.170110  ORF Transcript_75117/g.170110 Transcript_75117/m.170110 type:complete len:288 (-) Transcript_75117:559-1422(-)